LDTSARDGGVDDLRTCRRRGACDAVPATVTPRPPLLKHCIIIHSNFVSCSVPGAWAYHSHYIIQAQVMYDAV
jgi:hypothetical protein